jgi:DNA-binding Lrp family transcriptional regulator
MAMKLQVPPRDEPLLARFIQMSPAEVASLLQTLREEQPSLDIEQLVDAIADRLSLDRGKTSEAIRFLANLSFARQALGMPIDEFVTELRAAIETAGKKDLFPGDWETFQTAVTEALSGDNALAVSSKALEILGDNEKNYCYARVLTDLRPVFRSDVEQAPVAMVAVHALKIAYHQEGEHRDFFISLDRADLEKLSELIQRAIKKEESLKALMGKKDITFLEVKSS